MGTKRITPIKAIRLKCLECCCGQAYEVKICHIKDCALWPYRMGHRPDEMPTYETPEISEDRRAELSARMKNLRRNRTSSCRNEPCDE